MEEKAMSLAQQHNLQRVWKVPTSPSRWLWLAGWTIFSSAMLGWYIYTLNTQQSPGPFNDPLRLFGIIAFMIILVTASYSLRRRFVRGLPGKVQDWLWMHIWAGIATILIALLHENFVYITHGFIQGLDSLTNAYWGLGALLALVLLVVNGIIGRFIDIWQTHSIAHEASTNGVGIARALEECILELEYTVERLCAGKSEPFKQYCLKALSQTGKRAQKRSEQMPALLGSELADFQQVYEILTTRAHLSKSLWKQQNARRIIATWRAIHIVLACLALIVITYHSIMELLTSVFHVVLPG
jgi:hypothetical protein